MKDEILKGEIQKRLQGKPTKLIKPERGHFMKTEKQAAKQIIDRVPDQASWDDIMYEFYVKQKIEKGLKAVEEGCTVSCQFQQLLPHSNNSYYKNKKKRGVFFPHVDFIVKKVML